MKFKLYLAVPTTSKGSYGLLTVEKMSTLIGILPSKEEIGKHILTQYAVRKSVSDKSPLNEYRPIQVKVSQEKYIEINKEINRKIGRRSELGVINISFDLNTLPIIQVVHE